MQNFLYVLGQFTIAYIAVCLGVFCLSFFLKHGHFVMPQKRFFHEIKKQEEMNLYLPGSTSSRSFVCCYFMHYLFTKVFCNILIQKFQNLRTIIGAKNTAYFCFCSLWQSPTFQIIYKHPLSRSFLDSHLTIWDWTL